jgi:hypothetical protein
MRGIQSPVVPIAFAALAVLLPSAHLALEPNDDPLGTTIMSDGSATVNVIVLLDDEGLNRVDEALRDLRAAGLSVHKVMPSIGTITGSVEEKHLQKLRHVRGVSSVEISREYRVPPPDSEVQ